MKCWKLHFVGNFDELEEIIGCVSDWDDQKSLLNLNHRYFCGSRYRFIVLVQQCVLQNKSSNMLALNRLLSGMVELFLFQYIRKSRNR